MQSSFPPSSLNDVPQYRADIHTGMLLLGLPLGAAMRLHFLLPLLIFGGTFFVILLSLAKGNRRWGLRAGSLMAGIVIGFLVITLTLFAFS